MRFSPLLAAALVLLASACSSDPDRPKPKTPFIRDSTPNEDKRQALRDKQLSAEALYKRARTSLDEADFSSAIEDYDKLTTIHPFSDYATQGELERIYAEYRSQDSDRATTNADKFLREHPRHPAVDYVQYLKGLVNFSRDEQGAVEILPMDPTKSEVTNQRRAFDDFALLLQKYPSSKYAGDAYQRMVYVRSRLAEHELHVVDFYVRRGAYMAAAKRAEQIIALYPGTKASYAALESLANCYDLANLKMQAAEARKLIAAQAPLSNLPEAPGDPGFFGRLFSSSKPDAAAPVPPPIAATPAAATAATTPAAAPAGDNSLHFYADPADAAKANADPAATSAPGVPQEANDAGVAKSIQAPPTPTDTDPATPATGAAPVLTAPVKAP